VYAGGRWTHYTHPGWSTVNSTGFGGIALYRNFVYVADMSTGGGRLNRAAGIIRFDTRAPDFSPKRVVGDTSARRPSFIDIAVGWDGLLYGLESSRIVHVYDLASMQLQRGIRLAADCRAIAVNSKGEVFGASWNGSIYHFDARGAQRKRTSAGPGNLTDIDLSAAGRIVIGSRSGKVFLTDESLSSVKSFKVGGGATFVAFGSIK